MKKATLVKLLCLAIACMLLIPMVIACGEDEGSPTTPTTEAVEKVIIDFRTMGGDIIDGDKEIEIEKGSKLRESKVPEAERSGYTFVCWSYTKNDPDDAWDPDDKFREDTTLFAVWQEKGGNNPSNPSNPSNPGDDDDDQGTTETVTITFNTGTGYFEDNRYEVTVTKNGYFNGSLPTPLNENPAMKFDGWFKDALFQVPASRSDKYAADTTLYAKWSEQIPCADGSFDHNWDIWDEDGKASCTKPGTTARYCLTCNSKEIKTGDPALGHNFGPWEESFMKKQRQCSRLGCGEYEYINYQDVTISVLGNDPSAQVKGSTDKFYVVPFTNLVNGKWDEGFGEFVGPKGTGEAYVTFTLIEATVLDRIYFKGEGVTSINVFVQYEGEDDFVLVGVCGSAPTKEATPYVEPDATRKIVSIKFVEKNPPQGTSKWQEVAFVKVTEE